MFAQYLHVPSFLILGILTVEKHLVVEKDIIGVEVLLYLLFLYCIHASISKVLFP